MQLCPNSPCPTPGQLLLNRVGETVLLQDIFRKKSGAFDLFEATRASTKTFEGLYHFPFRGWIEKSHFFFRPDLFQGNHFHSARVKKHVGVATVVDVLEKLRLHGDVVSISKLNSQVGRLV